MTHERENPIRIATARPSDVWSVILAGGEGERTREFIKERLGVSKPKQYCRFVGSRSLLQHTIDRADALAPPEQRVIVVAREHRDEAIRQTNGGTPGALIFQPANRGTAPGVYLPLTYVLAKAPDATIVIYPSDHFVYPKSAFVRAIERGIALTRERDDRLVVFGVPPDHPETDYGWIQPGNPIPPNTVGARDVAYFIEKPTPHTAEAAFHRGALWSTSIVIGKVGSFWELGWRYLPEMMRRFEALRDGSSSHRYDGPVLERIYRDMPTLDFSRNLVELAHKHLAVIALEDVLWSDWGSPERIVSTLEQIRARPSVATNGRGAERSQRHLGTLV